MDRTPTVTDIIDRMTAVHHRIGRLLEEWRSLAPTMLEKDVRLQEQVGQLDKELDELRALLKEAA